MIFGGGFVKICVLLILFINSTLCLNNDESSDDLEPNSAKNGNETRKIIPRILKSESTNEKKDLNVVPEANHKYVYKSFASKNKSLGSQINFSKNLDAISQILGKLDNGLCARDIFFILDGLLKSEKHALQLFDSFSKFPLGLLYGNFYQLGNFDECIGVKHEEENFTIFGQYCLAEVNFELDKNHSGHFATSFRNENLHENHRSKFNTSRIHWGICLPSSCLPKDATLLVKEIFSSLVDSFKTLDILIKGENCYYENSENTSIGEILYGCIIAIFVLFIIICTLIHIWHIKKRKKCVAYNIDTLRNQNTSTAKKLIISFSIIRTVGKFLQTKPNDLNLECICGIKFISMGFIVVGHSLIFIFGGPVANADYFDKMASEIKNSMFLNNPLLVDTFLLVSGFLMCRLLLIELDKRNGKINFLMIYIGRYIRLTPAYLVVLGLYLTWLPKLGDGPLWKDLAQTENNRCFKSWWTNLLYVNNYINTDALCMFQSWYLAVDYHLFIIAPFIIYPIWKWKKIGMFILTISTLITAVIPFYVTFRDSLDPTLLAYPPEILDLTKNEYFVNAYIKTHMRASSYFLGLFFGYVVHKIQANSTKIPNLIIWIGWILATILGLSSMFSIVIFFDPNYNYDSIESAVYASLHRVTWSLAIGWVIVLCVTDNAAVVNKFLAWKPFIPASRLTYCAYLVNGLVEIYSRGTLRESLFLSKFDLACRLLGHLVLTFFSAFFLCIFFESPIHVLEKILLRKDTPKKTQNQTRMHVAEQNDC